MTSHRTNLLIAAPQLLIQFNHPSDTGRFSLHVVFCLDDKRGKGWSVDLVKNGPLRFLWFFSGTVCGFALRSHRAKRHQLAFASFVLGCAVVESRLLSISIRTSELLKWTLRQS